MYSTMYSSCAVGFVLGMIVMLTWRICSICSKKAHKQYFNFGYDRDFEVQKFMINVLIFAGVFEMLSCSIGFVLLVLPVSILRAIWVRFKVCCKYQRNRTPLDFQQLDLTLQ